MKRRGEDREERNNSDCVSFCSLGAKAVALFVDYRTVVVVVVVESIQIEDNRSIPIKKKKKNNISN